MRSMAHMLSFAVVYVLCIALFANARDVLSICKSSVYATGAFVKKTSGTWVKQMNTVKPVELTWFEAATCCQWWGLTLASIKDKVDLDMYAYNAIGDNLDMGWVDINGFGKDWRNLKGEYVTNNDIWMEPPGPVQSGNCKKMIAKPYRDPPRVYYNFRITNGGRCDHILNERLFCEGHDVLRPTFVYDCNGTYIKYSTPKSYVWYEKDYWSDVLRNEENCTGAGGVNIHFAAEARQLMEGWFIADSDRTKLIPGHRELKDSTVLFVFKNLNEVIVRPTFGMFLSANATKEYPFGNLHGLLKPHDKIPLSAEFVADNTIRAKFIPDSGAIIEGVINQQTPITFKANRPPYITASTPGYLKPFRFSPISPLMVIHGSMKPTSSPQSAEFTADATVYGSFIPDSNPTSPYLGQLTQTSPPEFIPFGVANKLPANEIRGVWKPQSTNPLAFSPVRLVSGEVPNKIIFKPIPEDEGYFVAKTGDRLPYPGYMTKNDPKLFTSKDQENVTKPLIGTWHLNNSPEGIPGRFEPGKMDLPPESVVFSPGP